MSADAIPARSTRCNRSRLFLRDEKHSFLGISLRAARRALVRLPGVLNCLFSPTIVLWDNSETISNELDCVY
jgi:hypothetical protein